VSVTAEQSVELSRSDGMRASGQMMPALDGLRAISICLVLFAHAGISRLFPGGLGVLIFFVISGFLISRLMIAEINETGTLSIRLFYARRILRLFPTLMLMIAIFTPLLIALGAIITTTQVLTAALYFANYYHLFIGYPNLSPFPTLWSLAVEEHFYIVFPFIVWAYRAKITNLLPWLFLGAFAVLLWRFHLRDTCGGAAAPFFPCGIQNSELRIYTGTDSIIDCILIGAIAAFGIERYPQIVSRIFVNLPAFWLGASVLLLTLVIRDSTFRETIRYTLQAASIAVIMLNVLFGKVFWLKWFLELPIMVTIGRWSYALYVYHFAVLTMVYMIRDGDDGFNGVIGLVCTFALAGPTYQFVEKPVRKLRRRYHAGVLSRPPVVR
jgi:peptidoglycan/LPS O-acetylase OafA/YrhL